MNQLFYPADQVDSIMSDLLTGMESAVETAKSATAAREALEQEIEASKVQLQKIAGSGSPALDEKLVNDVVQTLVDCSYLNPDDRVKLASELMGDPNKALRLVAHITQISAPSPEQGSGLSKPASSRVDSDFIRDGWDAVLTRGAA